MFPGPATVHRAESGARIGVQRDPDRAVAYLPHPLPVTVALDPSQYQVECWNLGRRNPSGPVGSVWPVSVTCTAGCACR